MLGGPVGAAHCSGLVNLNRNNPKFIFDTVNSLTQKPTQTVGSLIVAGEFMDFFENKIKSIREEMYACRTACPAHPAGQDGDLLRGSPGVQGNFSGGT